MKINIACYLIKSFEVSRCLFLFTYNTSLKLSFSFEAISIDSIQNVHRTIQCKINIILMTYRYDVEHLNFILCSMHRNIQKSNENSNWNLIVTYQLLKHSVILMFDDNHKVRCFDMNHDNVCVVAVVFCQHCYCYYHYFFVNVKSTKSMVLDLVNFYRRYYRRNHFAYCSSFNFKIKQKQTKERFFRFFFCDDFSLVNNFSFDFDFICHRFRSLLK